MCLCVCVCLDECGNVFCGVACVSVCVCVFAGICFGHSQGCVLQAQSDAVLCLQLFAVAFLHLQIILFKLLVSMCLCCLPP